MWVRDHYFPSTNAHATWQRLLPFFRLAGQVMREADIVQLELRPFNDRQLNRDLAEVCTQVNQQQPALPDGRRLVLSVEGMTLLQPEVHRQQTRDHLIPTGVLRGISKVREVGHRTQPFGLRFQLCEPFAHLVDHLIQ